MRIAYGISWRHRLARNALLVISLAILIGSGVLPLGYFNETASAAATQRQCYDAFNNQKSWQYSRKLTAEQNMYNECRSSSFCTATTAAAGAAYGVDITCTNPQALDEAALKEISAAKIIPVRTLVCGTGAGGDKALEAYAACAAAFDPVFASCSTTGGSVTSAMEATAEATATCLADKYPSISKKDFLAAVNTGLTKGKEVTDAAIKASQENECAAKDPPQVYDAAKKACVAGGSAAKSTCSPDILGGVGWMVCPSTSWISKLADQIYGFVSKFLVVKSSVYDRSSATFTAWSQFRDLANVMFIIGFVVIVISQVTGAGISNYGLKRMLPRLIIMAVLVNISFDLCAIAVDISNVLGASLTGMMYGLGGKPTAALTGWEAFFNGLLAATIATGALAIMLLAISIPVLLAALLALVMVAFILIARQAIIILLIVVSPVAIALNLLPNTESWYKKWQKMFFSLLMVYPVTGALFGAGALASNILGGVAGDGGKKDPIFTIAALAAAALPLFMLPSVLKGSLSATGALGAKLQGLSDKATGRIGKNVKESSQLGAYQKAQQRNAQLRRATIQGGAYTGSNRFTKAISDWNSRLNKSRLTGEMGNRTAAQGAALADKLEIENVEAASAQIERATISAEDLAKVAAGGQASGINGSDAATRAAAMTKLAERGEMGKLADSWDSVKDADKGTRQIAARALGRSKDKPQFIGQAALADLSSDKPTKSFDTHAMDGLKAGAYSPEGISKASSQELAYAHRVASKDAGALGVLKKTAATALTEPSINRNVSKNRTVLQTLQTGSAFDLGSLSDHGNTSRRSTDRPASPPPHP